MTESSGTVSIVTDLKENRTIFFLCDCRSEVLVIEYDHHFQMADLAIYQTDAAYRAKMSLWQRLRYCWQVLWNKKPYADEIMLDNKQLLQLKVFLSSLDLNSKIGV